MLNGLNGTLTGTQGNFSSVVLGGISGSLLKGNGSLLFGAGFVRGDATLDNSTYLTTASALTTYAKVSSLTISLSIAGLTDVAVILRKTVVGTVGTVVLNIEGFSGTVGATTSILTSTTGITDASLRPQNGQVLGFAVRIRRNNVIQMGTLVVFDSGLIGLMDVLETANFWTSGVGGCGTVGDTCVTYTV